MSSSKKPADLEVNLKPGQSEEALIAEMAGLPALSAVTVTNAFIALTYPAATMSASLDVLRTKVSAVQGGDLAEVEAMLMAQATALSSIFTAMAVRAAKNAGEYVNASEKYMRMALRAQNQCRATLETLAVIKNPPTVFTKQMNVAQGHQQVINSQGAISSRAHADEVKLQQSKLLEANNGERLDSGSALTAGSGNPEVATLGAVHRSVDTGRTG